jgi:hypothetical protein
VTTTTLANCAVSLYPLEAGVALLIAEGTFLRRGDGEGVFTPDEQ